MARPRQPIELVLAKGKKHLTKKEIAERKANEVKANYDKVIAPDYLPQTLKDEFYRLANELIDINIMSNLDCEALSRFIVSEHQYQKAVEKSLSIGIDDEDYLNTLCVQEKLFKMCRSAASDLGLTISSRCKLVIPKKEDEKPQSKWSKFRSDERG